MPKILYISSANPLAGPGSIGMHHYLMLKDAGFDVDFLTLNKVEGYPEIKYIYKQKPPKWHNLKFKIYKKFKKCDTSNNHQFFYLREEDPPVSTKKILKLISNDYDTIIFFFWVRFLSYKSVLDIYNHCKTNPRVIFICADYSPMTGGCHFIADCINYKTGCGSCPMLYSRNPDDFTAKNVKYRKKIIEQLKPFVYVNSYMSSFFKDSEVMQAGAHIVKKPLTINHDLFKPYDIELCRKKYGISSNSKFIILFGCQSLKNTRKGMPYLIDALNIFYDNLSENERNQILLVSIGQEDESLSHLLRFERKHLGYVEISELSKIYSLANIFVCPSINDAGPSMVNQSIACGTPVVAFEMGSALDVVKDQGTGITVPLRDSYALSAAIEKIFRMDIVSYGILRQTCRDVSLRLQSSNTLIEFVKSII